MAIVSYKSKILLSVVYRFVPWRLRTIDFLLSPFYFFFNEITKRQHELWSELPENGEKNATFPSDVWWREWGGSTTIENGEKKISLICKYVFFFLPHSSDHDLTHLRFNSKLIADQEVHCTLDIIELFLTFPWDESLEEEEEEEEEDTSLPRHDNSFASN